MVRAECEMLRAFGDTVEQWVEDNAALPTRGFLNLGRMALCSIWSLPSFRETRRRVAAFNPDVVHVHNTVPMISPSVYTACYRLRIPVVHTLHNYKLVCPGAFLFRDGAVCETCSAKTAPYPAVLHGCYRRSRMQSAVAALGLVFNRTIGTYRRHVTRYIALTDFSRDVFIRAGLPADSIDVKPNFVAEEIEPGSHNGKYALFVGKIERLKGVPTLLNAWQMLEKTVPLKVVGRGSLDSALRSAALPGVSVLGPLPRERVIGLMQDASLLVFPSAWYEAFPMVIAEAFATGTPVVAARLGAMKEIVRDGRSGWHFSPGNPADLAAVIRWAWADPAEMRRRGRLARRQYEKEYCPAVNYPRLMEIYRRAIRQTNGKEGET